MLLATLKSTPERSEANREYEITAAGNGLAVIKVHQPAWLEYDGPMIVPVSSIERIAQIDDSTGLQVGEYFPPITVEDAIELDALTQQSTVREWAETMDVERI